MFFFYNSTVIFTIEVTCTVYIYQVIQNDINNHQPSIDSVNDAARDVIMSEGGADAKNTRRKLDTMNRKWEIVLAKTRDRQLGLDDSLREAKTFHDDLYDMLSRLSEIDGHLVTAKPVGGLPETAKEQLDKFMV